jgi:hypothetical protein
MMMKTSKVIPSKVGGINKILRMKYSFTSRTACRAGESLASLCFREKDEIH